MATVQKLIRHFTPEEEWVTRCPVNTDKNGLFNLWMFGNGNGKKDGLGITLMWFVLKILNVTKTQKYSMGQKSFLQFKQFFQIIPHPKIWWFKTDQTACHWQPGWQYVLRRNNNSFSVYSYCQWTKQCKYSMSLCHLSY